MWLRSLLSLHKLPLPFQKHLPPNKIPPAVLTGSCISIPTVGEYFRARYKSWHGRGKKKQRGRGLGFKFWANSLYPVLERRHICITVCSELQIARSVPSLFTDMPSIMFLSQYLPSPGLTSFLNRMGKLLVPSFQAVSPILLHKTAYTIAKHLIVLVLDCSISPIPKIMTDWFWLLFWPILQSPGWKAVFYFQFAQMQTITQHARCWWVRLFGSLLLAVIFSISCGPRKISFTQGTKGFGFAGEWMM